MPSSTTAHISDMMNIINNLQPKKILDVGIGFGKWGFLCRELLDGLHGRFKRKDWQHEIIGLEVYEKYINEWQKNIYNSIVVKEAHRYLMALDNSFFKANHFDLIILGDVLEHFEKEKAIEVLNLCKYLGKDVLCGIPIGEDYPQGECFGNVYETHRCTWTKQEVIKLGKTKFYKDKKDRDYCLLHINI